MMEHYIPPKSTRIYDEGENRICEYDPSIINEDLHLSTAVQVIKFDCGWDNNNDKKIIAKPAGYSVEDCNIIYNKGDGVIYIPADI